VWSCRWLPLSQRNVGQSIHIIVGSSHFILPFIVIVLRGMLIKCLSLRIFCSYFLLEV
jgi:hypothetical protein